MILVLNDLHGSRKLLKWVYRQLEQMKLPKKWHLVLNGDVIGSRGRNGNQIVDGFYRTRKQELEIDEFDYRLKQLSKETLNLSKKTFEKLVIIAVHSGTFLAKLAKESPYLRETLEREQAENLEIFSQLVARVHQLGGEVIYVSGNDDASNLDFDVREGVDKERLIPPEDRFFEQLARNGYFKNQNVEYPKGLKLLGSTLLVPLDELDQFSNQRFDFFKQKIPLEKVETLVCHYPPSEIEEDFRQDPRFKWQPNVCDYHRTVAVSLIIRACPNCRQAIFGHIHKDPEQDGFPKTIQLPVSVGDKKIIAIWNAPGNLLQIAA